MMFVKLFTSVLDSSLWDADDATVRVFITILLMADHDGFVRGTTGAIAARARKSIEETERAIQSFESVDPASPGSDYGGRRIEKVDGGWIVLNHAKYKGIRSESDRKAKDAKRKRLERESARVRAASSGVHTGRGRTRTGADAGRTSPDEMRTKSLEVELEEEEDLRTQSVDLRSTPASPVQLSMTPEPEVLRHLSASALSELAAAYSNAQDAADAPTLGAGTPAAETRGMREPGAPGEVPAQLSLTPEPEPAGPIPPKPLKLPRGVTLAAASDFAAAMVGELNRLTGMAYRADGRDAVQRAGVLVSLGYTPAQAVLVARHRHAEWSRDPAMAKYLRPATLLGQEKFPGYVEAAEGAARRAGAAPAMTPERRAEIERAAEERDLAAMEARARYVEEQMRARAERERAQREAGGAA